MKTNHPAPERLESRIAPALVTLQIAADKHSATFNDVDGNLVTVKVSAGTFTSANFTGVAAPGGLGDQLQTLDLSGGGFDHAKLSITAKKSATGDGQVNVGYIDSTGHDLGNVKIAGDLGHIFAGDADTTTPGLKSLSVNSMGRLGLDTQGANGFLLTSVQGTLKSLIVKTDIVAARIDVSGNQPAEVAIKSIKIGGSLIGGATDNSGAIHAGGRISAARIGGDIQGGTGKFTGILDGRTLGNVSLGGSLIGGAGDNAGEIFAIESIESLKIAHDVIGGTGSQSAFIDSNGSIGTVVIGGSLIGGSNGFTGYIVSHSTFGVLTIGQDIDGGSGNFSAFIETVGSLSKVLIGGSLLGGTGNNSGVIFNHDDGIGSVKIGGDLIGGSVSGSASVGNTGLIQSQTSRIDSITIGGSIIAGIDNSTGGLLVSGSISAHDDIGSLTVHGSLVGNIGPLGSTPVIVSARGQHTQSATTDMAIGKITIDGRVEFADILAGYDIDFNPLNADAQIGPVKVGGNWIASNLVAGALPALNGFGTLDNAIGGGSTAIVSKIARVTIGGQVFGTPVAAYPNDHYGFVAAQIGKFQIGAAAVAVPTTFNPLAIGATADVSIHVIP